MHEAAFSYESFKDDLETHLIVRAQKMMRNYWPVVVHDDKVDVYYLSTLKSRHLDTGASRDDVSANTIVHVMFTPTCVQDIERVRLHEDERKPPDRKEKECWDEYDPRLTAWGVERWCNLCYIA